MVCLTMKPATLLRCYQWTHLCKSWCRLLL